MEPSWSGSRSRSSSEPEPESKPQPELSKQKGEQIQRKLRLPHDQLGRAVPCARPCGSLRAEGT